MVDVLTLPNRYQPADLLKSKAALRVKSLMNQGRFSDVRAFCLFIGYPRSGHSIVGTLLDAHWHASLGNEADALGLMEMGFGKRTLFYLLDESARHGREHGRETTFYTYDVPKTDDGGPQTIHVVGDKAGGRTSKRLGADPALLDKLMDLLGPVTLKVIHVARNPFDNITTIANRRQTSLEDAIEYYFPHSNAVAATRDRIDDANWLEARHETFINDPRGELDRICAFLDLPTNESYLTTCAESVYKKPNKSREDGPWSDALKAEVDRRIGQYDFLDGYTFDS